MGEVDLEALVRWSPDLIIVPRSHYDGQARATLWMEHPIPCSGISLCATHCWSWMLNTSAAARLNS
ncbi:MAG: hypothetical protein IPM37_07385 [Hahellaceae bacterium]|nr:hypothetical protein [Hahellaceae bacterium]